MDSLPAELLQGVFETFVLVACGSPKILCSISRKWRIIALHTPKVWSRIAVGHDSIMLEVNYIPDASYTICETENRLKTIIARAGSAKLDVYVGHNLYATRDLRTLSGAWTTIDRDWLVKRCRKLTLWGTVHADDLWVRSLVELEEVVFPDEHSSLTELCEDMQANSPKLSSMELTTRGAYQLARIPALAARLRIIHVFSDTFRGECDVYDEEMDLYSRLQLDYVEELLWVDLYSANTLLPTTNRLRILTIKYYRHLDSNCPAWSSLTELRLIQGPTSIQPTQRSLALPALNTLVLDGVWVELAWIHAPTLRILRLLKGRIQEQGDQRRNALLACTLRPSIVYMEMRLTTVTLLFMLHGVWSGIQELHCTFHLSDDLVQSPEELVDHLSRTAPTDGGMEVCSQLKSFTIIFDSGSSQDLRIDVTSAMEEMVKSRSRFNPLTVALLGVKSSNLYGESTEWSSFA